MIGFNLVLNFTISVETFIVYIAIYFWDCIVYKISVAAVSPDEVESFDQVCDVMHTINSDNFVSKDQLLLIAKLPHEETLFNYQLKKSLLKLKDDPIFSMLDIDQEKLGEYYRVVETDENPEVRVTYYILCLMSNEKCYLGNGWSAGSDYQC